MMQRRGFLASMLAAGVAPAAVGSGILMPVRKIVLPPVAMGMDFGDGIDFTGVAQFHADRLVVYDTFVRDGKVHFTNRMIVDAHGVRLSEEIIKEDWSKRLWEPLQQTGVRA